jgi:anti-anti-sigma factor
MRRPGARLYVLSAMAVMVVVSVTLTGLLTRAGIAGEMGEGHTRLTAQLEACVLRAVGEAGIISAGIVLALALLVAHHMTRPVRRLNEFAGRLAGGELEAPVDVGGSRELNELGDTLARLATTLSVQDEQRRATAADVMHELRGLLGNVLGRIEAVQDGVVDRDIGLRRMAVDARRMERIVGDLGSLVEAQRPGVLVARHRIDLAEVVRERVAASTEQFSARSIAVLENAGAPVWMHGDRERLAQVVDNLLSNAARYTDPGGEVTVCLRRHGEEAHISVADSGIGIAAEYLPHVFDRFWRAPDARERVGSGSGVGLAVVRDLVVSHGGRVAVSSELGEGTRFEVAIPIDPADWLALPAPVVWKLHGDIDVGNARAVERELLHAVPPDGDLVLDLSDIGFFGSSGVTLLRDAETAIRHVGGQLVLVAVPPRVRRLFGMVGVPVPGR